MKTPVHKWLGSAYNQEVSNNGYVAWICPGFLDMWICGLYNLPRKCTSFPRVISKSNTPCNQDVQALYTSRKLLDNPRCTKMHTACTPLENCSLYIWGSLYSLLMRLRLLMRHTCMITSGALLERGLNGYPLIESFLRPKSLFFLCIFYLTFQ